MTVARTLGDDDVRRMVRSVRPEWTVREATPAGSATDAVLGHVDYKFWNVLVRPETGETTAVLDWGHATAMAPYYDLILTEEHLSRWAPLDTPLRRGIRAALEAGCAETNDLERDADFAARRELYLAVSHLQPLVWFSEWTSDVSAAETRERAAKHRRFVEGLRE